MKQINPQKLIYLWKRKPEKMTRKNRSSVYEPALNWVYKNIGIQENPTFSQIKFKNVLHEIPLNVKI
jgi:ribosomal protein L20A (L18A)